MPGFDEGTECLRNSTDSIQHNTENVDKKTLRRLNCPRLRARPLRLCVAMKVAASEETRQS